MITIVNIHEFSRKLLEPKQVNGKWVSTGFDKEIGLRCPYHEKDADNIPPSTIRNAVNNNAFRLNDSYPPAKGEIALIAKEIEQYAILAVANGLWDDSKRPLLGYRYFWLEKPQDTEIDGVGTLLQWWSDNNQPQLELKPSKDIQEEQKNNYSKSYYQRRIDEIEQKEELQQYRKNIEKIFKDIQTKPYIFEIDKKEENTKYPDFFELHSLNLYLQEKYEQPIAWSWNATNLENPDQFTLICCADEKSYKWNEKYSKVSTPIDRESPKLPSSQTSQQTSANNLKKALTQIAESEKVEQNFETLVDELKESNSIDWNWGQIIDETWFSTSKPEVKAKYEALILLLSPNLEIKSFSITPAIWIKSLKLVLVPEGGTLPVNEYTQDAIDIQAKLLEYCDNNPKAKEQLSLRINQIISQVLLSLLTSKENYSVIEWLFSESSTFWANYSIDYAQNLFDKLDKSYKHEQELNEDEMDDFISQLLKDLKVWEQKKQEKEKQRQNSLQEKIIPNSQTQQNKHSNAPQTQNWPSHSLYSYQRTAEIFDKIKAYPLAAFFYQLSLGGFPERIKNQCTVLPEIIPLKEHKEQKTNEDEKVNKINIKKIVFTLLWVILGGILGIVSIIGLQLLLKLDDKFLYSSVSDNKSEIIPSAANNYSELSQYLDLLETGEFKKDRQQANINNLNNLIAKIPNSNDEKVKKAATRKEYIADRQKLAKSPLYQFIKRLTPPINPKLKTSYKADQINAETPINSPEIKLAQESLKPLGIYLYAADGTWDQDISEAIKKFQTIYEIKPVAGTLGNETWGVLSILIEDRQVKLAAEKLKQIIEKRKNYQDLYDDYNKLKECKNPKEKVYSECLEELFKK